MRLKILIWDQYDNTRGLEKEVKKMNRGGGVEVWNPEQIPFLMNHAYALFMV